jgi:hypothetical protein
MSSASSRVRAALGRSPVARRTIPRKDHYQILITESRAPVTAVGFSLRQAHV